MEDLEAISPQRTAAIDAACAAECDSESTRVDDLAPPPPHRGAYEQEAYVSVPRCEDFELVDRNAFLDDIQDTSWIFVKVPRVITSNCAPK